MWCTPRVYSWPTIIFIYVNDVEKYTRTSLIKLYADDTVLANMGACPQTAQEKLQTDLNNLGNGVNRIRSQ